MNNFYVMLYVYKYLINVLKSQQSHDSETWKTFSMFFDMSLQKNVKSHIFWILKKNEKKRILELCY